MGSEACTERRDPAGLRLRKPFDQLLQVNDSSSEQSLNLDAGSAAELSTLEPMLGLQVGHDALAHNLAASEPALSKTAGNVHASTV